MTRCNRGPRGLHHCRRLRHKHQPAATSTCTQPASWPQSLTSPPPAPPPQVRVKYASVPATRFRPAAAELQAELGQMLACVRIKQQASMNAFATQLTQITNALGRPSAGKEAAACAAAPVVEQPPSPTAHLPKLQTALKVGLERAGSRRTAQGRFVPAQFAALLPCIVPGGCKLMLSGPRRNLLPSLLPVHCDLLPLRCHNRSPSPWWASTCSSACRRAGF